MTEIVHEKPKNVHELAQRVHEEQLWRENVGNGPELDWNVVYHQSQGNREPDVLTPEKLQAAARAMWDAAGKVDPRVEIVSPQEYERRMKNEQTGTTDSQE